MIFGLQNKFPAASIFCSNTTLRSQENAKKTSNFKFMKNTMPPEKAEVFKSMEDWTKQNILTLLKPVEKSWQPQDFLPNPTSDGFKDQIDELRERTKEIPDDYFVVLVGDMITEEALPTYQSTLTATYCNGSVGDEEDTPLATWTKAWSAEENRHGDLLNKYLYLSGRVDMKQVEKTIQYLIGSGMEIGTQNNPYLFTIYTSYQERATFISHGNTAKLALRHGDTKLAQICGTIASDEKRHEHAYSRIIQKLFELDPDETMAAFAYMMKRKIVMPAHFMFDGQDDNLFKHFSHVATRVGVYTPMDYIEILEHLVQFWDVENLIGLSSDEGKRAQDYVCGLAPRLRLVAEKVQERAKKTPAVPFSWIFNREV